MKYAEPAAGGGHFEAGADPAAPSTLIAARLAALRSSAVRDLLHDARRPGMLSLAGGLPAPELFDVDGLRSASESVLREQPREALQYGTTEGDPGLRALLAARMRGQGARVADDEPVITTGSQQALDLVARALLDPGDRVAIERPGYLAALQVFALSQARCIGVPGDADGLRIDGLDALLHEAREPGGDRDRGAGRAKLVYVVTNFANPTGATLSLERRLALLEWATRNRVFVLEDDPYGALRIDGETLPPLVALAAEVPGARQYVGYVSSLSKTLAPGLRIGYAVVPAWLRDAVVKAKQALDLHTSTLAQAITARYLSSGRLEGRLPAICAAYRERRDALCSALADAFGDALEFVRPQGGMFVWARFRDGTDTSRLLPLARDAGMIFVPGEAFYGERPDRASFRLSFATAAPARLAEAVARLSGAHRALRAGEAGEAGEQGDSPAGVQSLADAGAARSLAGARSPVEGARSPADAGSPPDAGDIAAADSLVLAAAVRQACVATALDAWEDAGIRGLCAEGRWEVAIGAVESLDLRELARAPRERAPRN